jgi:hypothetical protein
MSYTITALRSHGVHRGRRFSALKSAVRSHRRVRNVALGLLAAVVLALSLLVSGLLHVHGPGDVAVGTQSSYCGFHVQRAEVSFYCQAGH